jgi:dihydroorotate dehydrogenase
MPFASGSRGSSRAGRHKLLYDRLLRPLLFRLDPETGHHLALRALETLCRSPAACRRLHRALLPEDDRLTVTLFGQPLPHPIGLAAGFDKNARTVPALFTLGFSFVEVGAVSGQPEAGNARPRIFRLPEHQALINRMGLPNEGAAAVAKRLAALPPLDGLLGANIVKAKSVPATSPEAIGEYARTFDLLFPYVRFFTINISSPSSPDLRTLNAPDDLRRLLRRLTDQNAERAAHDNVPQRALLLKISPDLSDAELDDVLCIAMEMRLDGIVATNTTAQRPDFLTSHPVAREAGGLSGPPLRERSNQVIGAIYRKTRGALTVLGVGGVLTAEDVWEKLAAGASAVELYTALIYRGPAVVGDIVRGLSRLLDERRVSRLSAIVGSQAASDSSHKG